MYLQFEIDVAIGMIDFGICIAERNTIVATGVDSKHIVV